MYLDYYKLKEKPFQITADPKFLWLGEKHKEAMATLRYGILDNRGFLLLTGEVGTGKTVMINRIVSLLDIDTVVATLPDPDLESMDFYNLLADGLNMDRSFDSKGAFLIHLRDFLHQSYAKKQQVLLIIDESQRLNHRLMEDIRVLSNIELHDRKLINIFFVGQQELNSILMTPQNRALAQRITVRYHIEPLNLKETGQYITHRLKVAGSENKIFTAEAIEKIFHFSGGIPRLINIISDHSMLTGYARDVQQLDEKIIIECAEELRIPVAQVKRDAATIQSPIGVSATTGGSTPMPASMQNRNTGMDRPAVPPPVVEHESVEQQPLSWKLISAGVALLLLGLIAFGITQFTGNNIQRWDVDELTPQKYKTTLEKEKAVLSKQIKEPQKVETAKPVAPTVPVATESRTDTPPVERTAPAIENSKPNGPATGAVVAEPKPDTPPVEGTAPVIANSKPDKPAGNNLERSQKQLKPLPLIKEKVRVQFKINSNEIDAASYIALDRIAEYLIANTDQTIYVRGYTDTIGSQSYNVSMSRFRASAVKSYLVGKGVIPKNITVFAMGAKNPIAPNDTYRGRQKNRRVEIEIPSQSSASN